MLDYDLARIYQVETGQLKRQVRRNIERFEGDDFMFEITHEELLRCQIGTSSWGGSRYGAFAFTELGVAMLSGVLNSKVAVDANRKIMRAFVCYRHLAEMPLSATYLELRKQIENLRAAPSGLFVL
ncbi:MAG: ORF6N domain-containing protein [Bacteroidales bacterium]|nr:ORF6N domain-containing protein [Bacteroidales bacterium]